MTLPLHVASFSVIDYVVFLLLLAGSLGIGAYYGIRGNQTTDEFLLAGRSMSSIPVALSLIATFVSSISLLGKRYNVVLFHSQGVLRYSNSEATIIGAL